MKGNQMKKLSLFLINVSVMAAMPVIAGAAGTYYNGNLYQNPHSRYSAGDGGYYNSYGAGRGYGQQNAAVKTNTINKKSAVKTTSKAKKQGFELNFGLAHEDADWRFELDEAGSKLHYDDVSWNVISGEGAFYFGDAVPMQIKLGLRYGKQYGESHMVDDDISEGRMWENIIDADGNLRGVTGTPAISAGTSKDGTQFGFNASFGLTDVFSIGKIRFTPSLGYRYLKYELSTKDNTGLMVDVLYTDYAPNCQEFDGEIQCIPYVGFVSGSGTLVGYATLDNNLAIAGGASSLDLGGTYYYEQPGTSHKYKTEWAGPYVAMDMEYAINDSNTVAAGLEFGLPLYKSVGDQPYRIDWEHSKSVEDKGGFGDAYHVGLNAGWSTMFNNVVGMTIGFTYDYYKVSKADAKTFLNEEYYTDLYDLGYITETDYNTLKAQNWVLESKSEVSSVYKAMGIRAGLNIKF